MLLTIPMGPLDANCYLMYRQDGGEAVLIDPSDATEALAALRKHKLHLTHILLTHRHFDHIAGVAGLKAATNAAVLIHALDAFGLFDPRAAQAAWMGGELTPCEPTTRLQDGDCFTAAGYAFCVLHTPGHTEGGVCYVCEKEQLAFTGDTVFCDGVGRTDLPGGNMRALMHSLCDRILTLPGAYTLYPGHGEPTTVAHEAEHNPLLQYRSSPWFN